MLYFLQYNQNQQVNKLYNWEIITLVQYLAYFIQKSAFQLTVDINMEVMQNMHNIIKLYQMYKT